jgi:hypothetical protein
METGETGKAPPNTQVFGDLTPDNRARLQVILRQHLPEVFELDRIIEQKTGYASEICKNMKIDVLSHLATLAKRQHELSHDEQASQLAKIEEHLHRAIIEHPEEVLRNRIVDIEKAWDEYMQEAYTLRASNELNGVPRHRELEDLRKRIGAHLEAARRTKPDETSWEESLDASAQVTKGADLASELADKLNQCVGEARRVRERKKDRARGTAQWAIGILVVIFIGVGGYFVGRGDGGSEDEPAKQGKASTPHRPGTAGAHR